MKSAPIRTGTSGYSFGETIRSNPYSAQLVPPAGKRLMHFHNLFGFVREF